MAREFRSFTTNPYFVPSYRELGHVLSTIGENERQTTDTVPN